MSPEPHAVDDLWAGVGALVEDFDFDALAENGLVAVHAGAVRRHASRRAGARVAVQLMVAAQRYEHTLETLGTVVAASSQPIVILKGPEVAQRYPHPSQRQFADIDVLTRSPERVVEDLVGLGYRPLPDIVPEGHHHLAPMVHSEVDFSLEVHRRPGWLSWMTPPSTDALLERIVPARTPIDGLWTLDPIDHCLFVAVHAWADGAFRRGRDVLDIAAMRADLDPMALAARADEWGIGRMWRATERCVDALLLDGPTSVTTRLLTGHIVKGRVRGPVTHRLAVYLADFLVTSPNRAMGSAVHKLRDSDVVAGVAG